MKKILADIRLEGDVQPIRSDFGPEFAGRFLRLCDEQRIGRETINIGTLEQNGSVERSLGIFDSMQIIIRVQIHVCFPDANMPQGVGSLWAKTLSWIVDASNRTCVSVNPNFASPHEVYVGQPTPLKLLQFLASGY